MDAAAPSPTSSLAGHPAPLGPQVSVSRWPTELPLLILVATVSLGLWAILALSILGLVYAVLLAIVFFVAHLGFIAAIRGSAVKLGPDQFPELHDRVQVLARRAGLRRVPDAYVLQADGSLNAFATRFFRSHLIVLFADLLDACGEDLAARDMIIGHEIGHVAAGHLRGHWFLLPGLLVPLLGAAYSRAREHTCDRYGAALCGDPAGAVRGLAILAAGGRLAPRVNLRAFVDQQADLDTGWMTIGRWLASYPPLSTRVEALLPGGLAPRRTAGPLRAVAILGAVVLVPLGIAIGVAAALGWNAFQSVLARTASGARSTTAPIAQVEGDLEALEALLTDYYVEHGEFPADWARVSAAWRERHPERPVPADPFAHGSPYGYLPTAGEGGGALVYSVGPDGIEATDDDVDRDVAVPNGAEKDAGDRSS